MSIPDLFLVLAANFAWGFNFIAGKEGANQFQPLFFTAIRFAFLLVIMLPWLKPAPGAMKPLLQVATLLGVFHFGMIFMGLHAGGNIASVAIATQLYVPFSAILAFFFLRERMAPIRVFAVVLSLFGVLLIGFDPIVFDHLDALFWVAGAAFVMAVATILMRQCPNLGVFRLQAWIALVATPSTLLLSLIFESGQAEGLAQSHWIDFWAPLYSAVGASVVGHGIVYFLVGRYQVSLVTPMLLLAPILATVFGIFWYDDELGWKLIVGGVLTLTGILLASINLGLVQSLWTGMSRGLFSKK